MSKKCHQDESFEYISDKRMTYTPGNASDSGSGYVMLPLNPHAKPFIQASDIKHIKDLRTVKFMTFCMILSLAFNLNWVKKSHLLLVY